MNVSAIAPTTSVISSPVTKRAMSMMCAFRSPCAPEPAFLLEPPEQRSRRAAPALQVDGADVVDPAERALLHELVRERDGGHAAVVVPDERLTSRRFFAASPIGAASASVPASGFSHATCLPASSAAIACSAWSRWACRRRPGRSRGDAAAPVGRRVRQPHCLRTPSARPCSADECASPAADRQVEELARPSARRCCACGP